MGSPDGPADRITVSCDKCGDVVAFHFDISTCSPFGMSSKYESYKKVMTQEEASFATAPRMDQFLDYVHKCKTAGDLLALEFMAEAIAEAKKVISPN